MRNLSMVLCLLVLAGWAVGASGINERETSLGEAAGTYRVMWNGTDGDGRVAASGIYFHRLRSNDITEARKMLLLK